MTGKILKQPRMMDIESLSGIFFTGPSVPCQTSRFTFSRWNKLHNLSFNWETKRAEVETQPIFQFWTFVVIKAHIGGVFIVFRP